VSGGVIKLKELEDISNLKISLVKSLKYLNMRTIIIKEFVKVKNDSSDLFYSLEILFLTISSCPFIVLANSLIEEAQSYASGCYH
jgi:hypothetical protein